jgi:PAS domain S-box-containing protein
METEQQLLPALRSEQLQNLYQLNEAVSRTHTLDEIYIEALNSLQRTLRADRASVLLFDPDGVMRFKAWRGLSDDYRQAVEGHSPWSRTTPDPQPVMVADVLLDPSLDSLRGVILAEGVRSLGFIPLLNQGELLGKFMLYYDMPHFFTEDEILLARIIATHIAFAIERKRTEERLGLYREIIAHSSEAIAIVDPHGAYIEQNPVHRQMIGYDDDELADKTPAVHLGEEIFADVVKVLAETGRYRREVISRTKRGEILDIDLVAFAVRNDAGKPICYVGVKQDITERKRAEEERERLLILEQQARRDAERANRLKDQFLATVSHELRTPLTAMLGWTQMLREGIVQPEDVPDALRTIERNARLQTRIIDELLDISRIVTGKLELDRRPVEPASFVSAAVEALRPTAEAKGIRVRMEFDTDGAVVSGDPARLQQVVWNLLSNAIKFTSSGGEIVIATAVRGNHFEISVCDTGAGISPEFLPFVFDLFRQGDGSSTRQHGGLGLGLAIVRQLVELHGGNVRAESPGEGKGAMFIVQLPHMTDVEERKVDDGTTHEARLPRFDGGRRLDGVKVLIVEDQADTRELLGSMLQVCGASVVTVSSAAEALELFPLLRPDLLVSDIAMPSADGYDLIESIRRLPEDRGGGIPAIALTAYAREEDRVRVVEAGFQLHLPKPVDSAALVSAIAKLVQQG